MRWLISDHSCLTSVRVNQVSHEDLRPSGCSAIPRTLNSHNLGRKDSDAEYVDADTGDSDRLFTFEVAETNEREKNAVARPGFQVLSHSSFSCLVSDPSKM
jgi:hypothetical protein